MVEPGFSKGQSDNLPYVDEFMVANYIKSHECYTSTELRGVKASRASREEYGDNAIGYVQVKRDVEKCIVKGKITPEHNVTRKGYAVEIQVDEKNAAIEHVTCGDCAASEGGCKHGIAFLMWVHRDIGILRQPRQSVTGRSPLCRNTSRVSSMNIPDVPPMGESTTFRRFLEQCQIRKPDCQKLKHIHVSERSATHVSMHFLYSMYTGTDNCEKFLLYLKKNVTDEILKLAAQATQTQYKSPLWFELRYGRITASRAHEVAHCKKTSGTLIEYIMGAARVPDTATMKRGRLLEDYVREALEAKCNIKFHASGFLICKYYPFIGVLPDGLSDEYCLEIKCPAHDRTIEHYIKDNILSKKCYAQVQLQMYVAKKDKCLFCVAHPSFSDTKEVDVREVPIVMSIGDLLIILEQFWKQDIYKKLYDAIKI
ncbi:uncharacterized protein CBL_20380 [Carabus blaptoides fortunei]